MVFFAQRRFSDVETFLLKYVNNQFNTEDSLYLQRRRESRARLNVVVLVIPFEDGQFLLRERFTAVSKEFSSHGMSLILSEPQGLEEVVIALKFQETTRFLLGEAKHMSPMGGGFYQLGIEFREVLHPGDHRELRDIVF